MPAGRGYSLSPASTSGLSEAIQEEAARRTITALIAAELIEEAAIEEASEVALAALVVEEEALDEMAETDSAE